MTFRSSLLFAARIIFPKTDRNSSARKSLLGAVMCIAISLVPLVVVLAVSDGMINGMTERIINLSSSHLAVYVSSESPVAGGADTINQFADLLLGVDGVENAYPEISMTALATGQRGGSYRTGAHIRAVPSSIFRTQNNFSSLFAVKDGDVEKFSDGERNAVIGAHIAEILGVKAGDTFRLITLSQNAMGNFVPRTSAFTVAAIVSSGYQELDALWVFIPLDVMFQAFSVSNADVILRVETSDAFSPDLVRIEQRIKRLADGIAYVYRWDEMNVAQFENFSSTRVMLLFIMMLIVLVASINISAALVMLVMERKREIAILKSIGATSRGIAASFIMAGGAAGLGGVAIGLPLGIVFAVNSNKIISAVEKMANAAVHFFYALRGGDASSISEIMLFNPDYYLTEISVSISFSGLFIITLATLILSVLVSLLPAIRAGNEKPLETLRKS